MEGHGASCAAHATMPGKVDVRDMVCAQALAVVAQAIDKLDVGASIDVLVNAEDVRYDLLVWAASRHHQTQASEGHGEYVVQLTRGA